METAEPIPFNRPSLEGDELRYMQDAVESGHTSMSGPFSRLASDLLREAHGAEDLLLTTSCTDALEMAAMLLDVGPGDTVIVPSFTFVSTALAFARQGARLLFADIEPTTLGIDPQSVASLVDDTVRAVVPVHYGGIGVDLVALREALGGREVDIVEDNAHGLFASRDGRTLGTTGRLSTLSFHETKNFICGEGGALICNDAADVERAHVLRDKGTNRRSFMLGTVDKYSWQDTGSSFGLSDILAGFLYGQLEQRETILAKRRAVWDRYAALLGPEADELGLVLPSVPEGSVQGYHLFYVLLPSREERDATLRRLNEAGIGATFHYVPLHSSPGGRRFSARATECPVTDDISGRLLRLPFHNNLSEADQDRVLAELRVAVRGAAAAR